MSRFLLSMHAQEDLRQIRAYFDRLPKHPTQAIASELFHMLHSIGDNPHLGIAHSDLTRAFGEEIRSRFSVGYRIYYRLGKKYPEMLGILHSSRDQRAEMLRRVQ